MSGQNKKDDSVAPPSYEEVMANESQSRQQYGASNIDLDTPGGVGNATDKLARVRADFEAAKRARQQRNSRASTSAKEESPAPMSRSEEDARYSSTVDEPEATEEAARSDHESESLQSDDQAEEPSPIPEVHTDGDHSSEDETTGEALVPLTLGAVRLDVEGNSEDSEDSVMGQRREKLQREMSVEKQRARKKSMDEMEMMPIRDMPDSQSEDSNLDVSDTVEEARPSSPVFPSSVPESFEIDDSGDVEAARQRYERRESEDSVSGLCRVLHYTRDKWGLWSTGGRLLLVASIVLTLGTILLISLLPASFVYVDYDKMAFARSPYSGIDYSHVYESGCFLLAPHNDLVLFPATAQFLDLNLWIFDKGGLTIGLTIYLQYFLRPEELAVLYLKYNEDYHKIIRLKAESAIKNMAPDYHLEEFRLNRSMVESELFRRLRYTLAGDCCESQNSDRFHFSKHKITCNSSATCDHGMHVDLGFFQMGAVSVPDDVLDRYMRQVVLEMETERETYFQDKAVVEKITAEKVQQIHNEAKEIREAAEARSHVIKTSAEASRLRDVEREYARSLKDLFTHLNVVEEDKKNSFIYLRTLEKAKDNLLAFTYNYDKITLG